MGGRDGGGPLRIRHDTFSIPDSLLNFSSNHPGYKLHVPCKNDSDPQDTNHVEDHVKVGSPTCVGVCSNGSKQGSNRGANVFAQDQGSCRGEINNTGQCQGNGNSQRGRR